MFGFGKKKEVPQAQDSQTPTKSRGTGRHQRRHAGPYTPEQRRQAVEAYRKSGMTQQDFARTWGVSPQSLANWIKIYDETGPRGLDGASLRGDARKRGRKGLPESLKTEILTAKQENPDSGNKGLRNILWRFRGVKVSPNTVGKTLREANIPPVMPKKKRRSRMKRKPKVQRFERARPMQLWQTDITSYVLTRHSQRVYLTVFMDDYSRYIVSWALALQQTKEFVMETLLQGIGRFGKPEEVLTDQGRQYFSWRGKSDFRKLLKKQGIRHVVARAHHPQTVGKCERFWETVGEEFWDRVEPQELNEAKERFEQFVNHYNHFRPHQGIDGHVPADRFFGAAADVRKAVEDTISKNALRLAVGEAPRKPVFLIGQIGDTPVSLHGEKGKLVLQTPDGTKQHLDYEDFGHAKKEPTTNLSKGEIYVESRVENGERSGETATQEEQKSGICPAETAGLPGPSALGDGLARAETKGPRDISGDDGVLVRQNHEAGTRGAPENEAASDLAAVPTGAFGYGGRVTHPTQDAGAAGSEEHGPSDTKGSGERSNSPQEEDSGAREDRAHAGAHHRRFAGDAGLPRCEDPNRDARGECGVPGRDEDECSSKELDPENDESNTGGSSS